jgi:hypothetical protein
MSMTELQLDPWFDSDNDDSLIYGRMLTRVIARADRLWKPGTSWAS